MSGTLARQRPSIDLDDFERRLQAHTQRHTHEDDPLAELARIVGDQPDPYGDVFSQQPATQADFRPGFDPHARADAAPSPVARQEPALGHAPRFAADFAAIEAGLRGAATAPQHAQQASREPAPYAGFDPAPEAQYAPAPESDWAEPQRARASAGGSRRPVYVMAASIAVAVVGIGVAFAYKGTGSSPREIKTIMAASGPTKIQPPADAASDVAATQDAAALGQTPAPTKLVSREEQPVDLSQAVQDNAARDAAGKGTDAASVPVPLTPSQAAGTSSPDYSSLAGGASPDTASSGSASPSYGNDGFGVGMPKAKKVKSVSVRPDGTIVKDGGDEVASAQPEAPASAKSSDRAEAVPTPAAATPKTATPKASTPKTSTRAVSAKPQPHPAAVADIQAADDAALDTPAAKPAKKAKPVRVATAETGTPDTAGAGDAAKPAGSGSFAVQLAAPASEADAKSATSRLLKKYGSALHGRRLGFHRAESNGRTVYRVRVSSLSKEDAASLCSKLKADGGTCFVARD